MSIVDSLPLRFTLPEPLMMELTVEFPAPLKMSEPLLVTLPVPNEAPVLSCNAPPLMTVPPL